MVIPGTLTMVMPMAQHRSDGPASRFVPCVPSGSQKSLASKTKEKQKTVSLFHAKCNCRIACWNVLTLGPLSPQSLPLTSVLRTMQERNIRCWLSLNPVGQARELPRLVPTPFFTLVVLRHRFMVW